MGKNREEERSRGATLVHIHIKAAGGERALHYILNITIRTFTLCSESLIN